MTGLQLWLWHLADRFKRLRRGTKDRMPYVRRRHYRNLQSKYAELVEAVHRGLPAAAQATIEMRKAPGPLSGRVCLFVTHAPKRELKTHVRHHLDHLLAAGLQVVLIVNTDLPLKQVEVPDELSARMAGVFVRANRGFDFGAWSHVLSLCDRTGWERLYLVNDSIVGPTAAGTFEAMMRKVDGSEADVVGLTENPLPIPHLQSYFLVFGRRALHSPAFARMLQGVRNLDDKGQVVEVYEVRWTRSLRAAGFSTQALFGKLPDGRSAHGDLLEHWEPMLAAGFPYVKTRVLQKHEGDPRMETIRAAARVDTQI
jgi:lipopolysaccharide biosynthesis protein